MKFNRGLLFNVGFVEALNDYSKWDCFIFHDIDHLPEDDRHLYACGDGPRLLAVAVDRWNYSWLPPNFFGAVTAISKDHFKLVNGFSNQFWGWGGEDDDMYQRIDYVRLTRTKHSRDTGR